MAASAAASLEACRVECSDQPLDVAFHPAKPTLLAAALVDGTVEVHDFGELLESARSGGNAKKKKSSTAADEESDGGDEIDTIVSSTAAHTQLLPRRQTGGGTEPGAKQASARCVSFSHAGNGGACLYSGGTAGDLVALDADRVTRFDACGGKNPKSAVRWRVPNASHGKSPLQLLHQFPDDPNLLVTGDEAGGVRVWDVRLLSSSSSDSGNNRINCNSTPEGCVFSWKEHSDYISGFDHSSDGNTLLACSADCTLSLYDLRKNVQNNSNKERFLRRSDDQEDELLSIKIIKGGRKVVCGTGEGVLAVWSWGTWGDVSDRFPGHPASVDALLKVDEDTLLTGSSDGLIRVVQIHPDKLLGVLGDHEGFPIEKLQMNCNRNYVGSVTHDPFIRLWDCQMLRDDYEDGAQDDTAMAAKSEVSAAAGAKKLADSDDEWEDMDDGDDGDGDGSNAMEEDSDSDDDSDSPKGKGATLSGRLKTDNERFFEDL